MITKVTGVGSPLILVPGGLTGSVSWEPFLEYFTDEHTVVLAQLLGVQFGIDGRELPKDYSVKTESASLAETINSLKPNKPIDIIAWSFGAFTSLDYALDHPDKIRSLTLIEPPAMWLLRETEKWDREAQATADFFQTQHGNITEDMLEEFLMRAGFVQQNQSPRDLPLWHYWVPYRQSLKINPSVVSHKDNPARLKNIHSSVLLVKGTGSTKWLHNVIDILDKNLPYSRVIELPGGHAPHIGSKDKFISVVKHFLNSASTLES